MRSLLNHDNFSLNKCGTPAWCWFYSFRECVLICTACQVALVTKTNLYTTKWCWTDLLDDCKPIITSQNEETHNQHLAKNSRNMGFSTSQVVYAGLPKVGSSRQHFHTSLSMKTLENLDLLRKNNKLNILPKYLKATPWKTNMEPENEPLEEEIPTRNHQFQVPC